MAKKPDYVDPWLESHPRGSVLMPAHRWNLGYKHDRVTRFDNDFTQVLESQFERVLPCRFKVRPLPPGWVPTQSEVDDPDCDKCGKPKSHHK